MLLQELFSLPFCHSYDYSSRRLHPYFPTAAAEPAFAKAPFSFQEQLTPYRSFSVFTLPAAAVAIPTGACICISLPILFQMPQQSPLPQKPHSLSDAAAEPTSAEASFSFRCLSRARFRRSHILFQMPRQSPLPQKPHSLSDATAEPLPPKPHSLSDAAAEPASAEATFSFRCRSRARFRRSHILFQMPRQSHFRRSHILFQMPQLSPLLQKPHFLSDAAAVNAPTEAFPVFPLLPQQ